MMFKLFPHVRVLVFGHKRSFSSFYDVCYLQLRRSTTFLRCTHSYSDRWSTVRSYKTDPYPSISKLVVPVKVKHNPCDINVGTELTGKLNKEEILTIVSKFCQREQVRIAATELGLDSNSEDIICC